MSALGFHPTHPGWQRLLDALNDDTALLGIDDWDNTCGIDDVAAELLPTRTRLNGDNR